MHEDSPRPSDAELKDQVALLDDRITALEEQAELPRAMSREEAFRILEMWKDWDVGAEAHNDHRERWFVNQVFDSRRKLIERAQETLLTLTEVL